jgi:DNA-binding HxlR family transcriptional regulator
MSKAILNRNRALQSREAVELLASKWRITVLHLLREGPMRTAALQAAIPEVSPKMLTQTLRGMERDGLLLRRSFPPPSQRIDYELTAMALSVIPLLQQLCHWAKHHVVTRDQARSAYDRGVRKPSAAYPQVRRQNSAATRKPAL